MKSYSKLEEKFEYDKELATELAEAMTELVEVQRRALYLQEVVKRHSKLKKFMWGSEDGRITAIHDLEDSHLANILTYLPKHDREVSPQLKAEARSRGMQVDGGNGLAPIRAIAASSSYDLDLDLDD
jgi:hypothetical protein